MDDLKHKAIRGGVAKIISQAATFVLKLGSLMIMARLLDPRDFGLVAMVAAIIGVFYRFMDAGLSMATVQRSTISQEQMSTLFWINVLLGAAFSLLFMGIAPLISDFYHEQRLYWIAIIMSTSFIFAGATAQHSALLQREMRFVAMSAIDIFALVLGIATAIVMALKGMSYWALVGQAITVPLITALCTWSVTRWLPGKPHRNIGIGSMVQFGGVVTLNNLVAYLGYNLEKILLGRFWGAEALGIYGRAFQIINIPTDSINSAVAGIALSGLSRIQDDPVRQKKYFLKGYSLVLTITLPITIAFVVFAEDLVSIILGAKWQEATPVFRLLTPSILTFALINPFGPYLFATGRQKRCLKMAFCIAPLVITAVVIGLPQGPKGVALAYSTAMALWVIPQIAWSIHGTGISGRDIFLTVIRPFISAIFAAIPALGLQFYFDQMMAGFMGLAQANGLHLVIDPAFHPFIRLTLGGSIVVIYYFWVLLYAMGQKGFYSDVLRGLKKTPQPKNA